MTAFISHSLEDRPEFDNIADALMRGEVPYWNPSEVQPGSSLRDQLRTAVDQCSVCIFIATHRSLQSTWCGAELGAFWGAGKPILVYISDTSVKEHDLPPIVHGDVWERRISRIVARASELAKAASAVKQPEMLLDARQYGIKITAPLSGDTVDAQVDLIGSFKKKPPDPDDSVAVIEKALDTGDHYLQHAPFFDERTSQWSGRYRIGSGERILSIEILGKSARALRKYYIRVGNKTRWTGVGELPPDCISCDQVKIRRR